jgi:hypothetical protein
VIELHSPSSDTFKKLIEFSKDNWFRAGLNVFLDFIQQSLDNCFLYNKIAVEISLIYFLIFSTGKILESKEKYTIQLKHVLCISKLKRISRSTY